jgi:3-hydroxybutyryl-CoA dehydrogenase
VQFRVSIRRYGAGMSVKIENVGVLGLGVMGFEIAFLYAMKGYPTSIYDTSEQAIALVSTRKRQTIERLKKRNRITDDEVKNIEANLVPVQNLKAFARAHLITEAVAENPDVKIQVYRELREIGFAGILTTNTSSVPRRKLLASGAFPSATFATTHFFNPVLYTQMVEVVQGDMENGSFTAATNFLKSLGRTTVETRDISGFVSNSILMFYAVMALRLLEVGARIEQVDQAARAMKTLPPLISFDNWRPSIVEDVTRIMDEVRDDRFLRSSTLLPILARDNPKFYVDQKPNEILYRMIDERGRGMDDESIRRSLESAIGIAAARTVELGESPAVVDFIAIEGLKLPEGPCAEMDRKGPGAEIDRLAQVNRIIGGHPLKPPRLLTAMAAANETFFKSGQPNPWLSTRQPR